jgi:hypothetical protein
MQCQTARCRFFSTSQKRVAFRGRTSHPCRFTWVAREIRTRSSRIRVCQRRESEPSVEVPAHVTPGRFVHCRSQCTTCGGAPFFVSASGVRLSRSSRRWPMPKPITITLLRSLPRLLSLRAPPRHPSITCPQPDRIREPGMGMYPSITRLPTRLPRMGLRMSRNTTRRSIHSLLFRQRMLPRLLRQRRREPRSSRRPL